MSLAFWLIQGLNSLALGGLLFLLSAGFSLIFGLMRIANLTHGAYFMLGAYIGLSVLQAGYGFALAVLAGAAAVAVAGALVERGILRRLGGNVLGQVLVTLGLAFVIADLCLVLWSGDPMQLPTPRWLSRPVRAFGFVFPGYRVFVVVTSLAVALLLWLLIERTRIGAMIRAGVDDPLMARGVGIRVPVLFTLAFCIGCGLAGMGGVLGGPILSVYPGLDGEMLPLALVVVILGGIGSVLGAFVGSFLTGVVYTFGQALLPQLAYTILFVPMILILMLRPSGLFGRASALGVEAPSEKVRIAGRPGPALRSLIRLGALAALAAPLVLNQPFYINVASQILIAAVFALSLNILVGYGGLTSLGHAAYLGTAAYVVAWLTVQAGLGFWPAAGAALVLTTLMAALFGLMALRGTGIAFLMITLALAQTLWGVAYRWVEVTGGDNGIPGVKRPIALGVDFADPTAFYMAMVALFLAAFGAMRLFVRSGLGTSLQGTRDQPRRMAMLGHNVWLVRWIAFVIAGFWGAVSGIAFVAYHGYVSPHALGLPNSAEALLMVIAGGAGTLLGPVAGAAIVVLLKMVVSAYVARWVMLLGFVFIAIVLFLPEGVVPGLAHLVNRAFPGAGIRFAGRAAPGNAP
jgi:ABC-type branched-subunit amino acid transport system permease subunit